jgi:WD40 repeat protein/serine/threonine protein kinase/tetratricopeptide (TPR) repeat protein
MNERTIFIDALAMDSPEERIAYLDVACGLDPVLRARVEALLRSHEDAVDFLGTPVPERLAVTPQEGVAPDGTLTWRADPGGGELEAGVVLGGRYKLLERIGEGGMGAVYMAQQTEPVKRLVAVKVIKAGMDSKTVLSRFEAERQALAMMDHPNIAKVLDAGVTDTNRPYFVMELVKGVPITKFCDDHKLTPRQRLELFVPVCLAIQHAHQKGVIHRDVKPNNVLVAMYDDRPVPKVIDFGVAKAAGPQLTDQTLVTGFGAVVGTPEYMSPEQASFNQMDVDTRSDVYSLGVLLYELLTGTTPIDRKSLGKAAVLEVLRIVRENEPPKPSTRLSTDAALLMIAASRNLEPTTLTRLLRGELDWIVMRALEKDRNRRYETANGFAQDVQRYLADEPVQACPPSASYLFGKFARRNKPALATVAVTAVAGLVTVTALAVSNVLIQRETDLKQEALKAKTDALAFAEANEHEAKVQEGIAKQKERTERQRYYAAQLNLAMQAWEVGDPARTLELLETQRPKFDQEDLRDFGWYYLWQLCHRGLRTRLNHEGHLVAFLPDGTLAVTGRGSFLLWDVPKCQANARWPVANCGGLSVSPGGTFLATWGGKEPTRVWEVKSRKQWTVFDGTTAPTFHPDGKRIAVARNGDIEFLDLATGKPHSVLHIFKKSGPNDQRRAGRLVFASDGQTAITPINNNWLRIYRWADGEWQEGREIPTPGDASVTAISPDGQTIAVGGNALRLYAADTGKELDLLLGHKGTVRAVTFSSDGKYLASAGNDRTVRLWDLATNKQLAVYPHPGPVVTVAFAPDGKLLASAGDFEKPHLWDTARKEVSSVLRHSGGVHFLAFTSDGKSLVTGGPYPTPRWDVATEKATPLNGHTEFVYALSPDGKTLAVRGPEKTVKLLDLSTREDRGLIRVQKELGGAVFSPDGKTLATWSRWGGDLTVTLWDVIRKELRNTVTARDQGIGIISSLAFSPDGKTLVAGAQLDSSTVIVWDVTSRERKMIDRLRPGDSSAWSVAFSPDGKSLAAGSSDGTIRLWNVDDWTLRSSLKGMTDGIRAMTFSPDGKILAAGSADRVRLLDVATGQERITLTGHTGDILCLAFAPDGNTLATGSRDKTVRLWRAAIDREAKAFRSESDPDDPDSPAAVIGAAEIGTNGRLVIAGRAEGARRAIEQAAEKVSARLEKLAATLGRDPVLAPLYAMRGQAYFLLDRWDKGAADLTNAIELAPDVWSYWADRADAHHYMRQWDKAVFDYSKALELNGGRPEIWGMRGNTYAELGQWKEATADFAKAVELKSGDPRHHFRRALTLLRLEDVKGYQKLCADMLGQVGLYGKSDPFSLAFMTCVVGPDAVSDWAVPLELAKTAVADSPKSYFALHQLGAVLYRAGRSKDALERLKEAETAFRPEDMTITPNVFNWLFLALAHQNQGNAKEARVWADKAFKWIDEESKKAKEAGKPFWWHRQVTLELLRREVEDSIRKGNK